MLNSAVFFEKCVQLKAKTLSVLLSPKHMLSTAVYDALQKVVSAIVTQISLTHIFLLFFVYILSESISHAF